MSKEMETEKAAPRAATGPGFLRVDTPEGPVTVQSIGQILDEMIAEKGVEGLALDVARMQTPSPEPVSWDLLVRRDRRLERVERLARRARAGVGDEAHVCGNALFLGCPPYPIGFKQCLELLVGWYRVPYDPVLSSQEAYRCAITTIEALMPPCKGDACGCL